MQKYLSLCDVASRRKAEVLIASGRVEVDGVIVNKPGCKVTENSTVKVDGRLVVPQEKKYYVMLNKPPGFITTSKDQFGRRTVLDLLDGFDARLYPVGRLDYDTSGLLLLTNDGAFAQMLTHPSYLVGKVYIAKISGIPDESDIDAFHKGILVDGRVTAAAILEVIDMQKENERMTANSRVRITVFEGRNRIVRKMMNSINHPVQQLHRIQIGSLELGDLEPGDWRELTLAEIKSIGCHLATV